MPLESCMILLDNSQYMRNGDYMPSRLSAQTDAANLLVSHKTSSNPESTVGIIAMNGGCFTNDNGVELLVSPTDDVGKLLGALHGIPISGSTEGNATTSLDVAASVQVASLALKHRKNKNGQQRIVIFVGSPIGNIPSKTLIKAGKTLKKNNVAIDIVAMGELEENEEKLNELINAANGTNSSSEGGEKCCHLVTIPPGTLPSDVLIASPVVHGGDSGGGMGMMGGAGAGTGAGGASSGGGGGGDNFAEYGGVDPNMDPELAMALRISMEEERTRQERIAAEQQQQGGDDAAAGTDAAAAASAEESKTGNDAIPAAAGDEDVKMEDAPMAMAMDDGGDEDAMLQQALAMSMAEAAVEPTAKQVADATAGTEGDDDEDDDEAMQMALAMSMQAEGGNDDAAAAATTSSSAQFQDPSFVNQLLGSMPGVDPNDPAIKAALEGLQAAGTNDGSKKDGDNDDKKKDDK